MEREIARFRREVEGLLGVRPGPGARYPEVLRQVAVGVALAELRDGVRLGSVAADLGVGVGTLRRWVEATPQVEGTLRAVEVVEDRAAVSGEASRTEGLVLVTASGHRVEGLGLAEVAQLLESLS